MTLVSGHRLVSSGILQAPESIKNNIALRDKNWFKTGGPARFFSQPQTIEEFSCTLAWAHNNQVPLFILGHGANVLISDDGFEGLVIQPYFTARTIIQQDQSDSLVSAQAGAAMSDVITYCLDNQLLGLEEFSGIPGTVGGSIYINLHYFEFLLAQFLYNAHVIDRVTGIIETVTPDWFNFGYNTSKLFEQKYFLISATFKLKRATTLETAFAQGRSTEIIRHRKWRYPQYATCGSFFRNFYAHEIQENSDGKKVTHVAYYLDSIGVKGALRSGNAMVSPQHANMIINLGTATSADIITLAATMQRLVQERFGIIPQPECQLIGFKEYPLL